MHINVNNHVFMSSCLHGPSWAFMGLHAFICLKSAASRGSTQNARDLWPTNGKSMNHIDISSHASCLNPPEVIKESMTRSFRFRNPVSASSTHKLSRLPYPALEAQATSWRGHAVKQKKSESIGNWLVMSSLQHIHLW